MSNGLHAFPNCYFLSWNSPVSGKLAEVKVWFKCPLRPAMVPVRLEQSTEITHICLHKAASLSQESQQSLREKNRRMFINCKAVTLLLYPEKAMRHQSVIPSSPVRSRFVRHSVDSTPTTSSLWMWLSVCSNTRGVITSFLKFGDFLMVCLTHTSDPFLSIFSLPKDN